MNKEEKEQWLYEAYQYTSNFDFSRLDKYEEVNDDICIDDLILDYTMLYELHKEEIERLKNNWNQLENYIKESYKYNSKCLSTIFEARAFEDNKILEKLQELKGDESNE